MNTPLLLDARDPDQKEEALKRAAKIIMEGGLVAFPTESFYGLGVDPTNEKAIEKLFKAKNRSAANPILLLLSDETHVYKYAEEVPEPALNLMRHIWPGRVTIVLRAKKGVCPLLTAGTGKLGMRVSSNELACHLAGLVGGAITGTSANISSHIPCSDPKEVLEQLGQSLDAILDGGPSPGGPGSSVIDVTAKPPRLIREGMVPRREIEEIIGLCLEPNE